MPTLLKRPRRSAQPKVKLTRTSVAKLAVADGQSECVVYDSEISGFAVRLRAGKPPAFVYMYRFGGAQRKHTLSRNVDAARKAAVELEIKVKAKIDPLAEQYAARKEKQKQKEDDATQLGVLVERYLRHIELELRPASVRAATFHLRVNWAPLHAVPLAQISVGMITKQLDQIKLDSIARMKGKQLSKAGSKAGGVNANRARQHLSALFKWAVAREFAPLNIVRSSGKALTKEKSRSRVLSMAELRAIWRATEGDGTYNRIVRLLMLTAARRQEIGSLRWSELNLDGPQGAVWQLPAERSKNHEGAEFYLSSQAVAELRRVLPLAGTDAVFAPRAAGFMDWDRAKQKLEKQLGDAVAPWVLHDLRRSVVSHMAEQLQINPWVLEACINHRGGTKAGVAGIYNRSKYPAETKAAMQKWADYLLEVGSAEQDNILQMKLA